MQTRGPKVLVISRSSNPDMLHYFALKRKIKNENLFLTSDDPHGYYWPLVAKNSLRNLMSIQGLKQVLALRKRILSQKVGTIIFDNADPANILISVSLIFRRVRRVFTLHDQIPHSNNLVVWVYNWLVSRVLAHEVIVFSSPRISCSGTVRQLTLGASPAEELVKVIGRASVPPTALFFGRVEDYKGYEFVDGIARALKAGGCDLVIAGKGTSPYLEQAAMHPNVTVLNRFIPDREAADLFNKAHVNIMPYREATQSGVLLFAAAFGVPTVAFDVGAIKEYMKPALGKCVPAGDSDLLADCALKYATLSGKDWASFQKACLTVYEADFSAEAFVRQYRDLVALYQRA